MTILSGRRLSLVDSARTGPGPGSCVLIPLVLAATPDAHQPLVVRHLSNFCGAARIAGRAGDRGAHTGQRQQGGGDYREAPAASHRLSVHRAGGRPGGPRRCRKG